MARPRLHVDEQAIVRAYADGTSVNRLAYEHGVDRYVIRRVLNDQAGNIIQFPHRGDDDVPPGHLTSSDLLDRAGISYRQLDYWTRAGILNPTNGGDPGSGRRRFYPTTELTIACLMRDLLEAGLNPRAAHTLARELADHGTATLAGIRIDLPQDL
jgi:hypothetical protein